jgi:hypothetical protein
MVPPLAQLMSTERSVECEGHGGAGVYGSTVDGVGIVPDRSNYACGAAEE